jgi:DNA-binding protein HU-beta
MGKKDFTTNMARAAGITHLQAQKAYAALLSAVKESLKSGRKVNLSGFGSFEIKVREARQGRNPKTGSTISIPRKKRIKFTPSRLFKANL